MSRRLSFSIAVNLLTENFKKGSSTVKNSLRSMQMQVITFAAALGAGGLGISGLISRFKNVARETSRVMTALKNVSDGTKGFADNLRFVNGLAEKYGLEVNALTGNFAQFTASATQANMPMEEQTKIFESLSRASTAFGLSAQQTDGVFLALSQMMGKGKISMEELRKQMGEKLPVAMQAMAKALGVSVGEMDKLVSTGKIMSADVLPKFADALNEIIPNVDTDNLEASLNRLSNVFNEIVGVSGFQDKYKALIDGLTSLLESASKNIQNIIVGIVAGIAFFIGNYLQKTYMKYANNSKQIIANEEITSRKMRASVQSYTDAKKRLSDLELQHAQANGQKQIALARRIEESKLQVQGRAAAARTAISDRVTAHENANHVRSAGRFGAIGAMIAGTAKKIGTAIKSIFSMFVFGAILAGITAIIGHFINLYKEAKRVKNIFAEYKKEAASINTNTQEVKILQAQLAIINDKKKGVEEINAAQEQLRKLLGLEKTDQKDLNKLVEDRIKLIKASAEVEYHAQKQVEVEDQIEKLEARKKEVQKQDRAPKKGIPGTFKMFVGDTIAGALGMDTVDKIQEEINQLNRVRVASYYKVEGAIADSNKINSTTAPTGEIDDKTKKKAQRLADELLELKRKNAQAALDLMDDNEETRLAQIELNYNRELDLIKKKEREWAAAQNGKLSTEQLADLSFSYELVEQKRLKAIVSGDKESLASILKSKVEYLKEYGSFQQKKLAIAEEYAEKIRQAEKEGNAFEIARLNKQKQIDIATVEVAEIKAEIDWQFVFGDLGLILEDQIKPTLARLKKYAKSDEFKNVDAADKKIIYDAIGRLEAQTSGGLSKNMFENLTNDMQIYQDSLHRLIKAKSDEEKAANNLIKANEKLKKLQDQNNKEKIAPAKQKADEAQIIFDKAAESVLKLTDENNNYAENLHNSSTNAINSLHNLEDGLNQLASGSLKNALKGVGSIGEAIGGKLGDALAKVFSGKGMVGEIIAAVIGILDILKDGIGTLVSELIDTVLNAVDGILSNILTGKMFEQIGMSLFNGVRNILDTVSFGVFSSKGNSKEVNNLINKLTSSNRYLTTAIEKLTNEMSKSGGTKSTQQYESALEKQKQKIENDRKMLESKMGYTRSHHSNNYYINKAFNAKDWKAASDYVGKKLQSVGDLWKLSPEDLAKLQELPNIWEKINAGKYNHSNWLNEYVSDAETLIELTKQWQDAITDTSFDSIRGEMKSLLADFKVSSEDAIASVDEFMKNAILHSIVSGTYSDLIKEWQAEFAEAMKDGILGDDEADFLRDKYQNIFDQALIDRDEAYKAAGIDDIEKNKSQDSTKGYSTAMDQDTGGAILGRITGIHESILTAISMVGNINLDTAKSLTQFITIGDELKKHAGIFYEMQQMQVKSYRKIEDISEGMAVFDSINTYLDGINKNTKRL